MDCLREEIVTGKKQYKCVWCGEAILKDEKHISRAYKFNGDFISDRIHIECLPPMQEYFTVGDGKDFTDEGFEPYTFKRGSVEAK